MEEISDIVSSDSLMFSKDSEKLGIFFTEDDDEHATVAFNLGVVTGLFRAADGVDGPKELMGSCEIGEQVMEVSG